MAKTPSTTLDLIIQGSQELGVTPATFVRMYRERPNLEQTLDQFYHQATCNPERLRHHFGVKAIQQTTLLEQFRQVIGDLQNQIDSVPAKIPDAIATVYPDLVTETRQFLAKLQEHKQCYDAFQQRLCNVTADDWYQQVTNELDRYIKMWSVTKGERLHRFRIVSFPDLRTGEQMPSCGGFFHFLLNDAHGHERIQYPLTLTNYREALIQWYPWYLNYLDLRDHQRHLMVPVERFTQIVDSIVPYLRPHDILDVDGYRDNGFYYVFERDGELWIIPTPGNYCLPKEALPMLKQFLVRYQEDLWSLYGDGPIDVFGFKVTDDESDDKRYIQLASSSDDSAVEVALGDYHFFVESGMENDLPEGVTVVK
jgi:hypothetical protein